MRQTNVPEPLSSILGSYFNVNGFERGWPAGLNLHLGRPENKEEAGLFCTQLADAIRDGSLTTQDYEAITGEDFETQTDLQKWLKEAWSLIFGDLPVAPLDRTSNLKAWIVAPESSAVRVALWRALHVEVDAPPPVIDDTIGKRLLTPIKGWRQRGDMDPQGTKLFRASIVARARFIDDLVTQQASAGLKQYVILGAGLDTFAQRTPDVASTLRVFEVDQPGPQEWKRRRLIACGYGIPEYLTLVPVDFEAGGSWWDKLVAAGFDAAQPTLVASAGVSMYLTRSALSAMLRQLATLAPGSTFAMTYLLPMEISDPEERPGREMAEKGARGSGTPFISYFKPEEITKLAGETGFKNARNVPAADLAGRYFTGRTDGLRPTKSEEILIATT